MKLYDIRKYGAEQLAKAGAEGEEATVLSDLLLSAVLGTTRAKLLAMHDDEVTGEQIAKYEGMLKQLLAGVPLQYILGECYFYGMPVKVGSGCFIPRSDTELLAGAAIELLTDGGRFADICSGSGCIAAAIAEKRPDVTGLALELYPKPLGFMKENIKSDRVEIRKFDALDFNEYKNIGKFDVITCNPPYIPREELMFLDQNVQHEPETALDGGEDGLIFYRAVTAAASEILNDGGALIYEVGYNQAEEVAELLEAKGFTTEKRTDFGGIERVVIGYKNL